MTMYNNAPANYSCPICLGIKGVDSDQTMLKDDDLVYRNDKVSVFINSFFIKGNEGHLIVVPNDHFENIYHLPNEIGCGVMEAAKKMAILLKKAYQCDGVTLRQNNEPAGDQHAFHFHLHVFPRYKNDSFNSQSPSDKIKTTLVERVPYIEKIRNVQVKK